MNKNKNLTEEQLAKIKKEISESMANDRHALLTHFPFTASIAMRLDLKPVRDLRCRTACTDAKAIYFDCDFYSKLTPDERRFVMAHEVWHCVMLHFARCQTRDRRLFNIATDMEVNNLLVDSANGINMKAPEEVLFPPAKMKGKSAEEIYDWLLKQAKKNKNADGKSMSGMNGDSDGSSDSEDQDSSDNNASGNKKSKSKKSGNSDNDGNSDSDADQEESNKKGKLKGQFDKHKYSEDGNESEGEGGKCTDQWGEVGFDRDFSPSISEDAAERMREAVTSAAQQCQRMAGGLPGAVEDMLGKLMKPEVNWREELCSFVTKVYGDGRTWLPPNRRHVYNDMYFQSRRDEKLKVAVAVDTSGSCVGDLPKFFGELTGLLNTFGKYELILIQNDYDISSVDYYDQDNPFPEEGIKWKGGGGTSFKPPFEWIKNNNPEIDCFVFFTDAYEGFYDDASCINKSYPEPPYPVLWILTKDGNNENFCPWGKKIYFKESAY